MMTSLREKKKRRTRAEILAAAASCIQRQGYRNANMRDIAAMAEVAYQTLYNYFPTKSRIALALLERDAEDGESMFEDAQTDLVMVLGSVAGSVAARFAECDRELWREAMVETLREAETSLIRRLDPWLAEGLNELLARAQQRGHLDAYVDTDTMATVIESILDSVLLECVTTADEREQDSQDLATAINTRLELVVKPYLRSPG